MGTRPSLRLNFLWVRQAITLIADLFGGIKDFFSVMGTVLGFFGLAAANADSAAVPSIPIDDAPFPVRLVLFLALSAGIGWTTGLLVRLAQRLTRDVRVIASVLLAMLMAGFVAGLADWLVSPRQRTDLPQEFLLAVIGAMFACRCMVENFGAQRGIAGPAAVAERSLVLLTFTIATAAILIFDQLGAR